MAAFLEMHLTSEVSLVFFPSGFTASWAIRMCELRSHFCKFMRAKKSVVRGTQLLTETKWNYMKYTIICASNHLLTNSNQMEQLEIHLFLAQNHFPSIECDVFNCHCPILQCCGAIGWSLSIPPSIYKFKNRQSYWHCGNTLFFFKEIVP